MNKNNRLYWFPLSASYSTLAIFFYFLVLISCGPTSSLPPGALGPLQTVSLKIGDAGTEIEVALSYEEQAQGLMYRGSMPENHGMLFVYTKPQYLQFWMKNTRIPLSIAFLLEDGTISNIENMKPYTGPLEPVERYASRLPSVYALEMNQGWFARHGVKEGDRIAIPVDAIRKIQGRGK